MPILSRRRQYQPRACFSPSAGGGATYVGPGDLVSGWTMWGGLRAFSAATAGNKAIRVVRASDSTQTDINSLTNGSLDVSTLTSFLTSTSGKLVTIYDQTGNSLDLTQATDANRPAIVLSSLGSLPSVHFIATNSTFLSTSGTITVPEPYTWSTVINPTSGDYMDAGPPSTWNLHQASGGLRMNGNADFTAGTDNTWHAWQVIHNSSSSSLYVDGSNNTGSGPTDGAGFTSAAVTLGEAAISGSGEFLLMETGINPIAFTTGAGQQAANLNSNAHTFYGF